MARGERASLLVETERLGRWQGTLRARPETRISARVCCAPRAWVMGEFLDEVLLGLLVQDWKPDSKG